MSGSIFGNVFKISTWGESHGKAVGVTIDGCPAGIPLSEEYIQEMLDRRKPGNSKYATKRREEDKISILSGIFEGFTTGTPIALMVFNTDQRSHDYSEIKDYYRPGHADYTYDKKYGFRDYRGGGRSSGRETLCRVAAGAVAKKILSELGVDIFAYTFSIGNVCIDRNNFSKEFITQNSLSMPDEIAYKKAIEYLDKCIENNDSAGGVVECIATGLKPGIGEPAFDKLDATIAHALFSIGAVKGVEFGSGFHASTLTGSQNNDEFFYENGVKKHTNNAGGILGGISDGSEVIVRTAFKPTSSIAAQQRTINNKMENIKINIDGRHDPIILARGVVVVESMVAISIVDLLLGSFSSNIDTIKKAYLD